MLMMIYKLGASNHNDNRKTADKGKILFFQRN